MFRSNIFNLFFILIFAQSLYSTDSKQDNTSRLILITSLYNEKNEHRIQEYIECLSQNLQNQHIEQIHVVYDTINDNEKNVILDYLRSIPSIKISYIAGRPTYESLFDLANKHYSGKKVMISNADIYFDESLGLLRDYDLTGKFISLSRWEVAGDRKTIYPVFGAEPYGADSWIFNAPIKKFADTKFGLGTLGCDGRIIYEAHTSGLTVMNPSLSIICRHVHASNVRNYPMVKPTGREAWLRTTRLEDAPADIIYL